MAGAIGVLAVDACKSIVLADSLDTRLLGAWATSQAEIIESQQIRTPAGVRRVQRVSHANGVVKLTTQCSDSISYTEQTAEIKFMPGGEISYSPTGDPSVNTTLIKCAI
jgi:hypothetical protein